MSTGRPYVIAKLAVSADGMVGRVGEGNVPITGVEAKNWTHSLRARVDGIAVGAKTFQLDQPALNVRLRGLEDRSPERFVFSTSEKVYANATTIDTGQGLSQKRSSQWVRRASIVCWSKVVRLTSIIAR